MQVLACQLRLLPLGWVWTRAGKWVPSIDLVVEGGREGGVWAGPRSEGGVEVSDAGVIMLRW